MRVNPKVVIVFFIKYFLGTIYVLPLWFLSVSIFEKIHTGNIGIFSESAIILVLDGAGIIFISLLILGCYLWSWLTFIKFTYEIARDGLHIHSGVIIRKNLIIPYNTIESADVLINPFVMHFLQINSIRIQTHELINTEGVLRKKITQLIPGLPIEEASALRSELLQYSHVQSSRKTFFNPVNGVYK